MANQRIFIPDGFGGYEMAPSFGGAFRGYEQAPNFGDFDAGKLIEGIFGTIGNVVGAFTGADKAKADIARAQADAQKAQSETERQLALARMAEAQAQLQRAQAADAQKAAPKKDNTMLYVGGGIAALLVVGLLVMKK